MCLIIFWKLKIKKLLHTSHNSFSVIYKLFMNLEIFTMTYFTWKLFPITCMHFWVTIYFKSPQGIEWHTSTPKDRANTVCSDVINNGFRISDCFIMEWITAVAKGRDINLSLTLIIILICTIFYTSRFRWHSNSILGMSTDVFEFMFLWYI